MSKMLGCAALAVVLASGPSTVAAQTFESVGTRAAGMGGAFVAVADDASAAYWNPAGFASGNLFTMVVDRTTARANRLDAGGARQTSGLLVSLGMPALAFSYYRLQHTEITSASPPTAGSLLSRQSVERAPIRLDRLVTNHAGATLVQSITPGIAVGATFKVVRGVASSSVQPDGDRGSLLGSASELMGESTSKFDADLGIMATEGRLKAGLTVRNLMQPEFSTEPGTDSLTLRRLARAGAAWTPLDRGAGSVD
jgi:hypothetical protein